MTKLLALTVGSGGSTYTVTVPGALNLPTNVGLPNLIKLGLNLALTAAILLSLFFVLFGGIKWMLSQGDKKQIEEAQHTITYAVIGLIITLLSFFIINLIGYLFNVPLGG